MIYSCKIIYLQTKSELGMSHVLLQQPDFSWIRIGFGLYAETLKHSLLFVKHRLDNNCLNQSDCEQNIKENRRQEYSTINAQILRTTCTHRFTKVKLKMHTIKNNHGLVQRGCTTAYLICNMYNAERIFNLTKNKS